jgi:2-aminoadipate transaminase
MRLPSLEHRGRAGSPVYRQIAEQIREQVESGEMSPGDRLPPIRALASQVGVNRDTVALAYEALASEGMLESVVGRGTFVCSAPVRRVPTELSEIALSSQVDRLLEFEGSRTRFGVGEGLVPLHSLVPDPAFYPIDSFRRALDRVLTDVGPDVFLYGSPQGHKGLRDLLAERFDHATLSGDDIVLCHGASQGIALALRLFVDTGDQVAVEVPTYHNVLATLVGLGLEPAPVAMDGSRGVDLEALERTLSRPEVKAFYTIPTFHNPMGITTSLAHRRALLEVAASSGVPVIEDAFESDLRYTGRHCPSLAALDDRGIVVQLSSFSKSLFPGLRVGAIVARGRMLRGLVVLKHSTDLSDSMPIQAALAEFVSCGSYDRHLNRLRRALRRRRDTMLEALSQEMPAGTLWTRPEGGYQVWVELPFEVDTRDLLADAARAGVLFAPGSQFLPGQGPSRCLRLTMAQADEDEIRLGVAALGEVVRERMRAEPSASRVASVYL